MKKRIVGLSLFIIVLVVFSFASMPVVAANLPVDESESVYSEKNLKKAEKLRQKIELKMEKQIARSLLAEGSVTALSYPDFVYLGTDITFTDADMGDQGKSWWGWAPRRFGSDYSFNEKEATAACLVGPGGWGGAGAWSWIGKEILVTGSGNQYANIYMGGHMRGITHAAGGASSTSIITLAVYDWNTGTTYSTTIYQQSAGPLGFFAVNQYFNNGIGLHLTAGHRYFIYVLVETAAAVWFLGECGAEFGPQGGGELGHVNYNTIVIDF